MSNRRAFTLVEVMIVVGLIALLAAIAIPNYLRQRISANETYAQASLKAISVALETYASGNGGQYPTETTALVGEKPPYLTVNFFEGTHNGYTFSEDLQPYTYSVQAAPISSSHGIRSFTITTGGVLTEN